MRSPYQWTSGDDAILALPRPLHQQRNVSAGRTWQIDAKRSVNAPCDSKLRAPRRKPTPLPAQRPSLYRQDTSRLALRRTRHARLASAPDSRRRQPTLASPPAAAKVDGCPQRPRLRCNCLVQIPAVGNLRRPAAQLTAFVRHPSTMVGSASPSPRQRSRGQRMSMLWRPGRGG